MHTDRVVTDDKVLAFGTAACVVKEAREPSWAVPDIHMPRNKDCVSPVHIEAQELCCGQQQACLVVCESVRDKVGDVPEQHTAKLIVLHDTLLRSRSEAKSMQHLQAVPLSLGIV